MCVDVDDLVHISALLYAEEQGLLLRLPCKVGDAVYHLVPRKNTYDVTFVRSIEIREKGILIFFTNGLGKYAECFGKTAFLTKAEAEKKLAEMGE